MTWLQRTLVRVMTRLGIVSPARLRRMEAHASDAEREARRYRRKRELLEAVTRPNVVEAEYLRTRREGDGDAG